MDSLLIGVLGWLLWKKRHQASTTTVATNGTVTDNIAAAGSGPSDPVVTYDARTTSAIDRLQTREADATQATIDAINVERQAMNPGAPTLTLEAYRARLDRRIAHVEENAARRAGFREPKTPRQHGHI